MYTLERYSSFPSRKKTMFRFELNFTTCVRAYLPLPSAFRSPRLIPRVEAPGLIFFFQPWGCGNPALHTSSCANPGGGTSRACEDVAVSKVASVVSTISLRPQMATVQRPSPRGAPAAPLAAPPRLEAPTRGAGGAWRWRHGAARAGLTAECPVL